ncbi:ankyrin repeat-containing protein At2g01680-like [Gastrolobium bilobum]|nr:ankyrin repeat-containing protein At2g01680-like [Gastrolobium bilobum]
MQDNQGSTALHIAAYCNHRSVMSMIIKYYPDCSEIVDNKGWNALHYAVNGYSYRATEKILRNLSLSNLYNEKDFDGNTPLHHMASSRCSTWKLVRHRRVDIRAINKQDQTALDVVFGLEDSDKAREKQLFIRILKRDGAKTNQRLDLKWKEPTEESRKLEFAPEAKQAHLIVATLIATVSFAAGFTLPGGTIPDGEHKGSPVLRHNASFKAFMLSNTISLVLSASAALIHLFSPLNNAVWTDQYLSAVAFSFTLVSVATMIVAFATGAYAVLGSSAIGNAVIVIALSYFLVFRHVLKERFGYNFRLQFTASVVASLLAFFNRLIRSNLYF